MKGHQNKPKDPKILPGSPPPCFEIPGSAPAILPYTTHTTQASQALLHERQLFQEMTTTKYYRLTFIGINNIIVVAHSTQAKKLKCKRPKLLTCRKKNLMVKMLGAELAKKTWKSFL